MSSQIKLYSYILLAAPLSLYDIWNGIKFSNLFEIAGSRISEKFLKPRLSILKITEQYLCDSFKDIQNILDTLCSVPWLLFYFSQHKTLHLGFIRFILDLCTQAPVFLPPGNFRSLILTKRKNAYECHVIDILRIIEGFQGFFFFLFFYLSGELSLFFPL